WAQLARKATKLCNTCRKVVNEADTKAATATARARELQEEAARYGAAPENMVELGQALGREEGAEVVARHEAWVRRQAMNFWARLARKATKLSNTCRDLAPKAAGMVASTTAWARELQDKAARYRTPLENMVELGQALGREKVAEVEARREAQVRRQAVVAATQETRANMERQRAEAALGLLERL
ncbi:unnamed protein product, partial [Coccothraustes coccothraustes]